MQYALLIYTPEPTEEPSQEQVAAEMEQYKAFSQHMRDRNAMLGGEALDSIATATTVRVVDGKTITTDGPFAETKETLGGFYLVEAADLDEAISFAAMIPGARHGCIEVRPVWDYGAAAGAEQPDTGAIWEHEHGPLGGDEINVLVAGANYGWPLVSYGTDYDGTQITETGATAQAGLEPPLVYWVPSIAPSGLAFYTGDVFAAWQGNALVGSMMRGRVRGSGHLQRLTFEGGKAITREPLLLELRQRIRDVVQGPDGLIYVLTDENPGVLLRLSPLG
jgi:hypothetical protein